MPDMPNPSYHPEKESVGELLAMTAPAIIVPDWQRNYSWKSEHTDTFWNDLIKFLERAGDPITTEYFFGSLVLVGGDTNNVLLLDGQQRLATSMILLAAIRDALRPTDEESAKWIQSNYLSAYDPIKGRHIHKLRLNVYDRDYFMRLISEWRGEAYTPPQPEHASHELIQGAKSYFDRQIESRRESFSEVEFVTWLKRLMLALTEHFTVIAATSENEDNAAEVFETLNDRGIGLSTPDLLRNLIIRRGNDGDQDQIVERWGRVIAFQTDAHIKAFLRHHWISRYGDVKTQSLYREVKSTVLEQNLDSLTLSTELRDSAELYRALKDADADTGEASSCLEAINSLGAGAGILFPALLSIFDTLEGATRDATLRALLNVYVRDGLIGQVENSVLENRFYSAARDLRTNNNPQAFVDTLAADALPDDDVRNRFRTRSIKHNGQRRYMLKQIELAKRATGEVDIAPPTRVHVEHIYPQTPATGQRWENHERWVNRLGNLTLLDNRINSSIRNGDFAVKRGHYAKSEILMTNELTEYDEWNSDNISARQGALSGFVVEVWPLITAV